jgi:hypothetical protein
MLILLFNWVGYRLLSGYLQHRSDVKLESRLDRNDYKEADLIQIKIPLHLPYQLNWQEFERVDGEVELDGVHYKYVKRKIWNDSLVLLCLPNESKQKIDEAGDDYFKMVADLDHSTQKKGDNSNLNFKNILSEFFVEHYTWTTRGSEQIVTTFFTKQTDRLSSAFHITPEQPPDYRLS